MAVHAVDERIRLDHRIGRALRRLRQLPEARGQPALSRIDPAHVLFHGPRGRRPAPPRHRRGDDLPSRVSVPRRAARRVHHADDGHARRRRTGVDDDVPPAAGRAQLPAVADRTASVAVGVLAHARHPEPRDGRGVALDAARDADRAGRARRLADRAVRIGAGSTARPSGSCSATSPCRWSRRSSSWPPSSGPSTR